MRLSLSDAMEDGRALQILTAQWRIIEENDLELVAAFVNDENPETYSRGSFNYGEYDQLSNEAIVKLIIPDYYQTGTYALNYIAMIDIGLNTRGVYFTDPQHVLKDEEEILDEKPATIYIQTTNPDSNPPVLDVNRITVTAEPTNPNEPDGETRVDITFRIKDDISGYNYNSIDLRDPQGVVHTFRHLHRDFYKTYFSGDPTVYQTYHKTIILPVGSVPGTWGISQMTIEDKAQNILRADFTEIVRFEVEETADYSESDINEDGKIDILDMLLVAQAFESQDANADVTGDGTVDILDLVEVASHFGKEVTAAPAANNLTAEQLQRWLTQAIQADNGSLAFRRGIAVLASLLRSFRPEKNALLPNYPNPFNPETWIPYQLVNAANVRVSIYSVDGKLIRTLPVGYRAAGFYQNRNRAAYWDGKNTQGESVSSGIYFYTLSTESTRDSVTADDFSATRKMLIRK